MNHTVRKIFEENGTFHRYSCPYTPQQNGRAERKHRHIVETGLAMLLNAHVPASFWADAFASATHIINRVPTPLLENKSPFQVLFNQEPKFSNFRVYGCRVFPYLRDYAKHKLEPRSLPCIFIGYCSSHKGFRCLDPTTNRVFISRHARFNESSFSFKDSHTTTNLNHLLLTSFCEDIPIGQTKSQQPNQPTTQPPTSPLQTNSHGPPASHSCPICTSAPQPTEAHQQPHDPLQNQQNNPTGSSTQPNSSTTPEPLSPAAPEPPSSAIPEPPSSAIHKPQMESFRYKMQRLSKKLESFRYKINLNEVSLWEYRSTSIMVFCREISY
ncbi:putative RNA-directed DNA polymerase [Helianthus annuus]|nr:putative RNA-directed DNA polymerase [Helianthus annuus]